MEAPLDDPLLRKELTGAGFGSPLRMLEETGSTNADALEWAEQGAPEGALVVADHQTEGRGRKGRTWLSEPGRALLFSLVLRPHPRIASLVSTCVGVGACEAIRSVTHLSALLKWPNDVVIDDRKLAGILIESRFTAGAPPVMVAGVGINVSWPSGALPAEIAERATSIASEMERGRLGAAPTRESLLGHVVKHVERHYRDLLAADPRELVTTAESLSALVGRNVIARVPGRGPIEGTVTGLDDEGRLELETAEGYAALSAGEVETVRRSGDREDS